MPSNTFDVLVIGEGLSGICAAATACQQGARVALVAKGPGTFMLGPACVDVQGLDSVGNAGFPAANEIEAAIAWFIELTSAAGCSYEGGVRERRLVPTSLGTFVEVSLAPKQLWKGDPRGFGKAVVVGVDSVFSFDAKFVAERLSFQSRNIGVSTSFRAANIQLPQIHSQHWLTLLEIATDFDRSASFRQAVITALKPAVQDADLLILPGMLGLNSGDADLRRFEDEISCAICELPTVPPSIPGLRLLRRLEAHMTTLGIEMCTGFAVQELCIDVGRCTGAVLDTPGKPRTVHADNVILSCGRFSKVLPEATPAGDAAGHAVEFNDVLQAMGATRAPLVENAFGCGSFLGKSEPRHRNAISITTGYKAAMLACRQGVHYARS